MIKGKRIGMLLLTLVILGAVVSGVVWNLKHYVMVDFRFYPRGAQTLNLREKNISIAHYENLKKKLPDCEIQWNIPFQGRQYPEDTTQITLTSLKEEDIAALAYLLQLETVEATGCRDYAQLLLLEKEYPKLKLHYDVELGGEVFDRFAKEVRLASASSEDAQRLPCMPELETLVCSGGEPQAIAAVKTYCQSNDISFAVSVNGTIAKPKNGVLQLSSIREQDIPLLQFITDVETLYLPQPEASLEALLSLKAAREDLQVIWEHTLCGIVFSSEQQELDLSNAEWINLDEIRSSTAWFPGAQRVFLGKCDIDNDTLAAFREEMRGQIKIVWEVALGDKLTARTDDTTFMPVRENVFYFNDEEAYNLRYCEDMVCVDIGHMSIHNIDFVAYMPNLEYLILAHCQLQNIDPISSCKKLKFLELDWNPLQDYSPLVGCTALEDLNIGNTFASVEPLKNMTWLKNLWMVGCSSGKVYQTAQALPDTRVNYAGNATVANGWRELPNYFAMRDLLEMSYMSW